MEPGCTEFTVTPSAATSRASVFRKPVTPARAVLERMSRWMGWRTEIEVMATTRPQPRSAHGGHRGLAHGHRGEQVELEGGQVGVEVGGGEGAGRRAAGVGHEDVDAAEPLDGLVDEGGRAVGGAHVGDDPHEVVGSRAGRRGGEQRLDGGAQAVGVVAADGDAHAVGEQGSGRREAESTR